MVDDYHRRGMADSGMVGISGDAALSPGMDTCTLGKRNDLGTGSLDHGDIHGRSQSDPVYSAHGNDLADDMGA